MKKSTMKFLVSYLNDQICLNGGEEYTEEMLVSASDEIAAELARDEAKAQANRNLYAVAHDIVMNALPLETPVTISELFDEIEDKLPDGFSKGKVQYAITRMWADEVNKVDGKVKGYTRKA